MTRNNSFLLPLTIFTAGAVVMIFELTGARLLAPYLGTSIYIWTAIIGVILGSLSLGYYLGGMLSDKNPTFPGLARIFFLAAILVAVTLPFKDLLLTFLIGVGFDIRWNAVIASLLLFAPGSIVLGMVSPYAVRLKMENIKTSGVTVGQMYAISTIGSIAGTFLAGFYLIPFIGNTKTIYLLSVLLVLCSVLLSTQALLRRVIPMVLFLVLLFFGSVAFEDFFRQKGIRVFETPYSHAAIFDGLDAQTGEWVRHLRLNNEWSSAMFLEKNSGELVFDYTKFYRLGEHFVPELKSALMIGGGAFSWPKAFLQLYPDANIDVVEIDPDLMDLAKRFFRLKDNPRLEVFAEDGRVFLNRTERKYDIIYGDAFRSQFSIPYQLATREAVQGHYDALRDGGVVLLNIIGAFEGENGAFLRAEYATYLSVFPQVYLFQVKDRLADEPQNIILAAIKSHDIPDFYSTQDAQLNVYLSRRYQDEIPLDLPVLTDDLAPVEHYTVKMLSP